MGELTPMQSLWLKAYERSNDELLVDALIRSFICGMTEPENVVNLVDSRTLDGIVAWFAACVSQMPIEHLRNIVSLDSYPYQEVPQISSFGEVLNAAIVLARSGATLSYRQLGGSLGHVAGTDRNAVAKVKYGENQGKLAAIMGLARKLDAQGSFESSLLGIRYFLLEGDDRANLVARLLFRSSHFRDAMCLRIPECRDRLERSYSTLATSTRERRLRSLRAMFRELLKVYQMPEAEQWEIGQWLRM